MTALFRIQFWLVLLYLGATIVVALVSRGPFWALRPEALVVIGAGALLILAWRRRWLTERPAYVWWLLVGLELFALALTLFGNAEDRWATPLWRIFVLAPQYMEHAVLGLPPPLVDLAWLWTLALLLVSSILTAWLTFPRLGRAAPVSVLVLFVLSLAGWFATHAAVENYALAKRAYVRLPISEELIADIAHASFTRGGALDQLGLPRAVEDDLFARPGFEKAVIERIYATTEAELAELPPTVDHLPYVIELSDVSVAALTRRPHDHPISFTSLACLTDAGARTLVSASYIDYDTWRDETLILREYYRGVMTQEAAQAWLERHLGSNLPRARAELRKLCSTPSALDLIIGDTLTE